MAENFRPGPSPAKADSAKTTDAKEVSDSKKESADASTPKVTVVGEEAAGPAPKVGDVPDPRLADDKFKEGDQKGYAGRDGWDLDGGPIVGVVAAVDPDRIPADVTPGVQPNAGGNKLLAAAQAKAPNLTPEFVTAYGFTDEILGGIARGEIPPPPAIGPAHTADLYLTPGGWQQTPPGVSPGASTAISR